MARCDCTGETEVSDTDYRNKRLPAAIRRKRICKVCGERFTTFEIREEDLKELQETARTYNRIKKLIKP